MIWFYRVAFLPLFLLSMPYYAWRMIRRGGYSKDFSHRFGLICDLPKSEKGKTRIWIQAVSVGEVEALAKLLKLLHESEKFEVVVTTTTSTGYKILREKYAQFCLCVGVFPFDFFFSNRLAWRRIKPDVCALMEGELWPEHMHRARLNRVPLLLLNARVSDRSFARYSKLGAFTKRIFGKLDFIAANSDFDAKRFLSLGAARLKLGITGNIKFDAGSDKFLTAEEISNLKTQMGFPSESIVLLGSSTWEGEEEMLIDIAKKIVDSCGVDLRLLLVPRHAERRSAVYQTLEKSGVKFHFRSENRQAPRGTFAYVGDTTGELSELTQVADLAFIGKSMPPHSGGQTPLDCAASSVACVYGSEMSNFRQMCQSLEAAGAVIKIKTPEDALEAIMRLVLDSDMRIDMGKKAKAWHKSNMGASARTFEIIKRFAKK